jgi:prepilin-type processing-associated H-X9-DG protein
MYTDDHDGQLVANNYVNGNKLGSLTVSSGKSWCPGNARTDTTTENIQRGLLFYYYRSTAIYHCPADNSKIEALTGSAPTTRTRSYSMSGSINCTVAGAPYYLKSSEIQSPSRLFVFIDAHEDSIMDAHFAAPVEKSWIDMPSDRHDQAGNLSFVDGHIERWRWAAPKDFQQWQQPATTLEDLSDLRRLQSAMRQQ